MQSLVLLRRRWLMLLRVPALLPVPDRENRAMEPRLLLMSVLLPGTLPLPPELTEEPPLRAS